MEEFEVSQCFMELCIQESLATLSLNSGKFRLSSWGRVLGLEIETAVEAAVAPRLECVEENFHSPWALLLFLSLSSMHMHAVNTHKYFSKLKTTKIPLSSVRFKISSLCSVPGCFLAGAGVVSVDESVFSNKSTPSTQRGAGLPGLR